MEVKFHLLSPTSWNNYNEVILKGLFSDFSKIRPMAQEKWPAAEKVACTLYVIVLVGDVQ